jgi:hypothetical protein
MIKKLVLIFVMFSAAAALWMGMSGAYFSSSAEVSGNTFSTGIWGSTNTGN